MISIQKEKDLLLVLIYTVVLFILLFDFFGNPVVRLQTIMCQGWTDIAVFKKKKKKP